MVARGEVSVPADEREGGGGGDETRTRTARSARGRRVRTHMRTPASIRRAHSYLCALWFPTRHTPHTHLPRPLSVVASVGAACRGLERSLHVSAHASARPNAPLPRAALRPSHSRITRVYCTILRGSGPGAVKHTSGDVLIPAIRVQPLPVTPSYSFRLSRILPKKLNHPQNA